MAFRTNEYNANIVFGSIVEQIFGNIRADFFNYFEFELVPGHLVWLFE